MNHKMLKINRFIVHTTAAMALAAASAGAFAQESTASRTDPTTQNSQAAPYGTSNGDSNASAPSPTSSRSSMAASGHEESRNKATAYVDDAAVTTAVKAKFVKDSQVRAVAISVETRDGVVDLSGNAKSEAEKARAEQIARATKGAREVSNNIVVAQ